MHAVKGDRPTAAQVIVVMTQDGIESKVDAGENKGKTLRHERLVREFRSTAIAPDGRGDAEFLVPTGMKPEEFRIVAFVQDHKTGHILGAAGKRPLRKEPVEVPAAKPAPPAPADSPATAPTDKK